MNDYCDYETSQRLKAQGFPQDNYPQGVWEEGAVRGEWVFHYWYLNIHLPHVAAPPLLAALGWLLEQDWHIWANLGPPGTGTAWTAARQEWMPLGMSGESELEASNLADLIGAMLTVLEGSK